MSRTNFSRLSKIAPMPDTTNCGTGANSYTCHAAVLHWAYMDQGCDQLEANRRVTMLTKALCPGCSGGGAHSSIPAHRYGEIFCHGARPIGRADLHTRLHPGDVLITGHPSLPNHSMVVRQVRGAGHVTVRGYNNIGTLGTGRLLEYDDSSHNITQDKYWHGDRFGVHAPGIPLYYISYQRYSTTVRLSMNMSF